MNKKLKSRPEAVVITSKPSFKHYWKDLYAYRELFFFLAWKDILVRYKQTVLGVTWAFLRPFLTMVVLTIVFGKVANLPSGGVPYAILVYSAMLPWQFFSQSFSDASNSLISNSGMLTKIFFPRIILPTSNVLVNLSDFFISFGIFVLIMIFYSFVPSWRIVFVPLFLLFALLISLGAGFFISSLNVKYRDFRYVVPFIVQFGLYISPVGFSSVVVPMSWQFLYYLNPMVAVIEGFRWSILGQNGVIYWPGFVLSVFVTILVFFGGIFYFRHKEKEFADII